MNINREIKFRALKDDMSNCIFVYGQLVYDATGCPRIIELDSSQQGLKFSTCIRGTEGQYTGLKDKNGKEIYEGDIIICDEYKIIGRPRETYASFTGYVKYSKQAYRYWIMIPKSNGKEIYNNLSTGGQYSDKNGIQLTSMKVIGNIYETPELLSIK